MSGVLYYSNSCPHSQKLLQELKKTSLATKFQYVCIDQRVKTPDGKTKIVLQNGKQVIMPPTLTSIPGLMLIDHNYQILYGDDIYKYLQPKQQQETKQATENNMEPNAFSFEGGGCVVSDSFSFLGQDLEALGDGGLRQMHHYESLNANLKPQQNLGQNRGQTLPNDNINQSNNRIREGEINVEDLAKQRGYNQSAGGPGFLK